MPPFPYLGSGSTDSVEIWYVVRDVLAKRFAKLRMEVQLYVRTCSWADVPHFPYLGKGWTNEAEIWHVARGPHSYAFNTGWEMSALAQLVH